MTYCPQDPNTPQLYVVKREFAEKYHSGSFSSIGPKLYLQGNAKSVAKTMNNREGGRFEPGYDPTAQYDTPWFQTKYPKEQVDEWKKLAVEAHAKALEDGPWIVVPANVSVAI